jgi:hypothetical protein
MASGKPWSHEELVIAMNLYCRLPFGQLHQRNPLIVVSSFTARVACSASRIGSCRPRMSCGTTGSMCSVRSSLGTGGPMGSFFRSSALRRKERRDEGRARNHHGA